MLKINELKSGDVIMVNDDGVMREGKVVSTSLEENQALVNNGIQDFWYSPEDMTPVNLSEEHLMRFGFTKEELDGGVKYKKDSFRLLTPKKGDFSNVEMWWREDRRHFGMPIGVHHFQNLFMDMTKIHLDMP
jgi:hypothetical protein